MGDKKPAWFVWSISMISALDLHALLCLPL
jgi:hypothetical protein